MKHTREPWFASEEGFGYRIMARDKEGRFTIAYMDMIPEAEANFQRIVAAVNACKGISTDRLEKMVPGVLANLLSVKKP